MQGARSSHQRLQIYPSSSLRSHLTHYLLLGRIRRKQPWHCLYPSLMHAWLIIATIDEGGGGGSLIMENSLTAFFLHSLPLSWPLHLF